MEAKCRHGQVMLLDNDRRRKITTKSRRAVARSEAVDPSSLRRKGQIVVGPQREEGKGGGERERLPPVITTKFTTEIQEDKMIPSRGPLSCVLS